jgi:lysine 2,3-aminomutase
LGDKRLGGRNRHLRTDVRTGLEIIKQLRGHTTGYSVPQYVIDAPGGGGKVPVNPEYVEAINDREVVLRNYEGRTYRYPLVDGVPVTPRRTEDVPDELLV